MGTSIAKEKFSNKKKAEEKENNKPPSCQFDSRNGDSLRLNQGRRIKIGGGIKKIKKEEKFRKSLKIKRNVIISK